MFRAVNATGGSDSNQEAFGLIFDLGVSEGNDTAYYLAKGFRVVAVEADPWMVARLHCRFAAEIASGVLKVLPFAASDTFGDIIDFHVHKSFQGTSGVGINPDLKASDYHEPQKVCTIDWKTLLNHGIPRYMKIDIENNELSFLSGMAQTGISPEFISVEAHSLDPVSRLYDLGYRRFKLVDQVPIGGFYLPEPQREGHQVDNPEFSHASGPFGLDVFHDDEWLDLASFETAWIEARPNGARGTWYDCHAWKPQPKQLPSGWVHRLFAR